MFPLPLYHTEARGERAGLVGRAPAHSLARPGGRMPDFVTTDAGSQEAQEGKFDDRVMAARIAWQARKRGVSRGTTQRPAGW